jgi:hypothetical protein
MIAIVHFLMAGLLALSLTLGLFFSNLYGELPSFAETTVPVAGLMTDSENSSQLVEGLEKIKAAMQKLHFCYIDSCYYRNIESKITPPRKASGSYTATISAMVDRPSANPDSADYHFVRIGNRWQLVRGEEYTDSADYVFNGDRYEIFSVHTNRVIRGNLTEAQEEGNLKSGYIPLYFEILNNGVER